MKKLWLLPVAITLAAGAAEASNVHIGVGINTPVYAPAPVYYQPAPVYYEPAPYYYGPSVYYPSYYNGRDRHRNYDWYYWHHREDERREHHDDERREHEWHGRH